MACNKIKLKALNNYRHFAKTTTSASGNFNIGVGSETENGVTEMELKERINWKAEKLQNYIAILRQ